ATSESPMPASQGVSDPEWALFPAGLPHPSDWQVLPAGLTEALLRCPAGRYLFMRLKLSGDGSTTPRVRRIHIDFPRSTSADLLPAVFRQDAAAGDFTERFLGLFDASLETVDAAIARFPALIDGARTRDEVLPWIAHFLSITLDQTWDADTRRRMLKAAPDLFRRRGTRTGLNRSIRLAYNLNDDPAIIEHGLERVWGAVADKERPVAAAAQLGHTRLFSRNRARLTLGASPLDQTPVMSYGNPVTDPHSVGAFRFTVSLPVSAGVDEAVLSRLVESQKPAHTLATLRTGSANGFRLGGQLRLGIDTLVVRPRPQVLNEPGTWLAHNSILGGETPPGPILGHSALSDPRTAAPSLSYPE
ncbi:MAG: phage tail protein, partial [Candidatus Thiodiazotropha sp.]